MWTRPLCRGTDTLGVGSGLWTSNSLLDLSPSRAQPQTRLKPLNPLIRRSLGGSSVILLDDDDDADLQAALLASVGEDARAVHHQHLYESEGTATPSGTSSAARTLATLALAPGDEAAVQGGVAPEATLQQGVLQAACVLSGVVLWVLSFFSGFCLLRACPFRGS
jgi:hypothetical protein